MNEQLHPVMRAALNPFALTISTATFEQIRATAFEQAAQLIECEHISDVSPKRNGEIVGRLAQHVRDLAKRS